MAIETPRYQVLQENGRIQLRKYDAYITASVAIGGDTYNSAANKGFRVLANYIFGNNTVNASIAMTAPVASQKAVSENIAMTAPVSTSQLGDQIYEVSFTMPSAYSMDDLPRPNNNFVKIKLIPPHTVAVIRFSGYTSEHNVEKKKMN